MQKIKVVVFIKSRLLQPVARETAYQWGTSVPSDAWSRHGATVEISQCDICSIAYRPPTRSAFDNDECHVTAFRPIIEAAHSWSYDNTN